MQTIYIASRKSQLALWQTHFVQQQLQALHPQLKIDTLPMSTIGDETLDISLSKIGGKGLFTKSLEDAMLAGKAQLAVHSFKDVPMVLPSFEQTFKIAAVLKRHSPEDVLLSNQFNCLDEMPQGAIIGTSSLRRSTMLKHHYPHLQTALLRGNINTRIAALNDGKYDAIILAKAGLERLQMHVLIKQVLDINLFTPAPTQGALAIEVYGDDYMQMCEPLNDTGSMFACFAERQVSLCLGGSCSVPLAAYAQWLDNHTLDLIASVLSLDGSTRLNVRMQANVTSLEQAINLGQQVAQSLQAKGADAILQAQL